MARRITKINLDDCEDAILDLIDLSVKLTDVHVFKKNLIYLIHYNKLKNCMILCYYTKKMISFVEKMMVMQCVPTFRTANMMQPIRYQKIVILVKLLVLEVCDRILDFVISFLE